jgi:hypothetical protein
MLRQVSDMDHGRPVVGEPQDASCASGRR